MPQRSRYVTLSWLQVFPGGPVFVENERALKDDPDAGTVQLGDVLLTVCLLDYCVGMGEIERKKTLSLLFNL